MTGMGLIRLIGLIKPIRRIRLIKPIRLIGLIKPIRPIRLIKPTRWIRPIRLIGLIKPIRLIGLARRIRAVGRHYLLVDGMHSCAYIPRHTYKYLNKLLERRLGEDPKAENSLRFVWSRMGGRYVLAVNPRDVDMTSTHGLARDTGGRILIPCPYIQQIYQTYGIEPEWCGRVYLEELRIKSEGLRNRVNGANKPDKADRTDRVDKANRMNRANRTDRTDRTDKADGPWLAIFEIHNS